MSTLAPALAEPAGADPGLADDVRVSLQATMDVITDAIEHHPRSQQKRIGPSEIGVDCDRALAAKIAELPEPPRGPAWKPTVGTACHTQMEDWFGKLEGDYMVEHRVHVGDIGDTQITGSTDLFLPHEGMVLDWKFVGPKALTRYKAKGPSQQYRTQAHLYGRGWERAGYPMRSVCIAFLPREGELSEGYWWWEPYDRMVALLALARANQLHARLQAEGLNQVMNSFPDCGNRYCDWCEIARRQQVA